MYLKKLIYKLFNKQQKYLSTPLPLVNQAEEIYNYYKALPAHSPVELQKATCITYCFKELLNHTGKLQYEDEYRRRLISNPSEGENPKTTKELVDNTLDWLEKQHSFDAGRMADFAHNLYFCLKIQNFLVDVKPLFTRMLKLLDSNFKFLKRI